MHKSYLIRKFAQNINLIGRDKSKTDIYINPKVVLKRFIISALKYCLNLKKNLNCVYFFFDQKNSIKID